MIDTFSQHNPSQNPHIPLSSPVWVAHRGGSLNAPENTLAAFRRGLAGCARFIEGDFRLTADGHIVACHDANALRTSGVDLEIGAATQEQLQRLDFGQGFTPRFAHEAIPTLGQVLALLPADKGLYIELKSGPEIVPALVEALRHQPLQPWQTVLAAFDPATLRAARAALPDLPSFWLYEWHQDPTARPAEIDELVATAQALGVRGLYLNACAQINLRAVSAIRAAGLELHIYTVNSLNWAIRCQALEVDSITSDRPDALAKELEQFWQQQAGVQDAS